MFNFIFQFGKNTTDAVFTLHVFATHAFLQARDNNNNTIRTNKKRSQQCKIMKKIKTMNYGVGGGNLESTGYH